MNNNETMVVGSIGPIYVNNKEYAKITEYKHYTKEVDCEVLGGYLGRRKNFVDIIDVTMPIFCAELADLPYETSLKCVGNIYNKKPDKPEELYYVGTTEEYYSIIKKPQFFVNRMRLSDVGEVTYRFYVSEICHSKFIIFGQKTPTSIGGETNAYPS